MSITIKKILVPTDFSSVANSALNYAANIAHKFNAEIVLLHVVETYDLNVNLPGLDDIQKLLEEKINEKMEALRAENSNLWGIRISAKHTKGKINEEINRIVDSEAVDLVVMGTTGASSISKRFFGSNARRTVMISKCPVITLKEGKYDGTFENIVLPLDLAEDTTEKIEYAKSFALAVGAKVHVVFILEFFDEFRSFKVDVEAKMKEVADALTNAGIETYTAQIKNKSVEKAVRDYANDVNAELTIIMTQRERRRELIIGSHARNIIMDSSRPVMSLRPEQGKSLEF